MKNNMIEEFRHTITELEDSLKQNLNKSITSTKNENVLQTKIEELNSRIIK